MKQVLLFALVPEGALYFFRQACKHAVFLCIARSIGGEDETHVGLHPAPSVCQKEVRRPALLAPK